MQHGEITGAERRAFDRKANDDGLWMWNDPTLLQKRGDVV